jgi:hypothetical protein
MAASARQLLASLAVLATGLASVATQPCSYSLTAETPPTTVDLGAQGSEIRAVFRARSDSRIERVEITARLVSGQGNVEIIAPEVWLESREPGPDIPESGAVGPFSADLNGTTTMVCDGLCAETFDVLIRRSSGMDPGSVELIVTVGTESVGCGEADGEDYVVVERVQ